jgi:beta-galactosidase
MISAAHQADPTRPAGLGGTWADYVNIADVNGYNGGEAGVRNPGVPNMQTEYGSCTGDRPGTYDGCYNSDLGVTDNVPTQFAWRSGASIWCAFHHGSALHQDNVASAPDMGNMGFIDHARLPLRRYYFYRNYYAGIAPPAWPAPGTAAKLKISADNATITDDGRSDAHLIVEVQDASGVRISNAPDITRTDSSGLGMFPTGSSITFTGGALEKGVRDGQAAIEFRSYRAGTVTITATSTGLASDSVILTVKHVPDPTLAVPPVAQ